MAEVPHGVTPLEETDPKPPADVAIVKFDYESILRHEDQGPHRGTPVDDNAAYEGKGKAPARDDAPSSVRPVPTPSTPAESTTALGEAWATASVISNISNISQFSTGLSVSSATTSTAGTSVAGSDDDLCLGVQSPLNRPQVDSDNDSAMGDVSSPESTSSLRSSIYDYVEEHGRTFHRYKQGKYWMPNDKVEQERLDLQHAVFMELLEGKFGLAPIENARSVLDIGTGTGIWAIEYAIQHPSAIVMGTDLSPIQPEYVPANCHFEVDDAEDDWVFNREFDYVHLRLMFHTFKSHQTVIRSAFANLRPGGWMEWQDYYCYMQANDNTMAGTALERWCRLYVEGGGHLGRDMIAPRKYKRWMEEAGFINVVEDKLAIPGNPWPKGTKWKVMGLWQMTNFLDGIHAVTMTIFTRGLGMTPDEVELLLVDVRKDIKNLGCHFYFLTYFVYGQKPFDHAVATES